MIKLKEDVTGNLGLDKTQKRFIFIGGLHRSGTSALYNLLGSDPRISIFRNTGVIEDEGQFLQKAYPTDNAYGGPGKFGLDPEAHLTESSPLIPKAKKKLPNAWESHWDISKPVLAEKTPSNIIKARFLQAIFPNSGFIFISRHPVAAAMATSKWTGAYMTTLIENWLKCHEILEADLPKLNSYIWLKYEDFTVKPWSYVKEIEKLLGFYPEFNFDNIKPGLNQKYYNRFRMGNFHLKGPAWKVFLKRFRNLYEVKKIERKFESRLNKFGYSFSEVFDG